MSKIGGLYLRKEPDTPPYNTALGEWKFLYYEVMPTKQVALNCECERGHSNNGKKLEFYFAAELLFQ